MSASFGSRRRSSRRRRQPDSAEVTDLIGSNDPSAYTPSETPQQRTGLAYINALFRCDVDGNVLTRKDIQGKEYVQCKICQGTLSWSNSGRTPLFRHALSHKKEDPQAVLRHLGEEAFQALVQWEIAHPRETKSKRVTKQPRTEEGQTSIQVNFTGKWGRNSPNMHTFKKLLTNFVVSSGSPFRIVEDPHFRQLIRWLQSKAPNISAKSISRSVSVRATGIKKKLISLGLKDYAPCLVADGWSQGHKHWLAVGAVFIDPISFDLFRLGLGTWQCPGNANADLIKQKMAEVRTTFGLIDYRASLVTDHESRMGAAAENDQEYDWHGCTCHRINLGVKKAIDGAGSEITDLIKKVHDICVAVMGSSTHWENFVSIQKELIKEAKAAQIASVQSQEEGTNMDVDQSETVTENQPEPSQPIRTVEPDIPGSNEVDYHGADDCSDDTEPDDVVGAFRKSDNILRLTLRNDIRWNTVWYMIERFLRLKAPLIPQIVNLDSTLWVSEQDWNLLTDLLNILRPYKDASILLEAEKEVTCSMILQVMERCRSVVDRLQVGSELAAEFRTELTILMDEEFDDKNWIHALGCMTQLDPTRVTLTDPVIGRYIWGTNRFPKTKAGYPTQEDWVRSVHVEINKLIALNMEAEEGTEPVLDHPNPDLFGMATQPDTQYSQGSYLLEEEDINEGSLDTEYNSYCTVRNVRAKGETVLSWWKNNQVRFPNVAKLAAQYLCIPASSCMMERHFSVNGHQLNQRRRNMDVTKVTDLTIVRDHLSDRD